MLFLGSKFCAKYFLRIFFFVRKSEHAVSSKATLVYSLQAAMFMWRVSGSGMRREKLRSLYRYIQKLQHIIFFTNSTNYMMDIHFKTYLHIFHAGLVEVITVYVLVYYLSTFIIKHNCVYQILSGIQWVIFIAELCDSIWRIISQSQFINSQLSQSQIKVISHINSSIPCSVCTRQSDNRFICNVTTKWGIPTTKSHVIVRIHHHLQIGGGPTSGSPTNPENEKSHGAEAPLWIFICTAVPPPPTVQQNSSI